MKVLAIDPGYDRVGVAVLEKQNGKEILIHSECILTDKADELSKRLFLVGTAIETLLKTHTPSALAIETLFFNKNQKTAIGVAQARGMIIFLGQKAGCEVYEFGPQEIKVAVTGYGKSDKKAVFEMVKRLVQGVPSNALDDEYDAIAVGLTCLAHHRK
ncbi:MAG: crossover junction endodeoxyribonuclease RuvC, crossover junction endodeoxyribonuclease RuvC [Candidatus Parcubacteria bacterium]|jgi:crossover junction endodeoxyribonuclease RuvC